MKKFLCLLLAVLTMVSLCIPALAEDVNIDHGEGEVGSGSTGNIWYGDCGIRASIIDAQTGLPALGTRPIDYYRKDTVAALTWYSASLRYSASYNNKFEYLNGAEIVWAIDGNYQYKMFLSSGTDIMPRPVSGKYNKADASELRAFFGDKNIIKAICSNAGFDYNKLLDGKYKIAIEPIAAFLYKGNAYALTATEAAMLDKAEAGGLRSKMGPLTHQNLPLALFLEHDDIDLEIQAWTGSKTDAVTSNDTIIEMLGLGLISMPHWTRQVRVNGTIDPSFTKEYYTGVKIGDVIKKDDVDISDIPKEYTIKEIENVPLTVVTDPDKNIVIVDCETTGYTVKVRINGTIVEDLTRNYAAKINDVIKREDVDTSIVPEGVAIVNIENVPLTVVEDKTKNIIIIDCKSEMYTYKVQYYLDGVLKDTEEIEAKPGTKVTTVPVRGYPGYAYDHTTGLPVTINANGTVICVYYVSVQGSAGSVNSLARLYTDEYTTECTNSKSGYGVYGLYYVDVTDYLNAEVTASWTGPYWGTYSCYEGAASGSPKTVKRYKNIVVKAYATYTEGMPITDANKNGTSTTIELTRATSMDRKVNGKTFYAFVFPVNAHSTQTLRKAYIPINWKDNTDWTINFSAYFSAQEYNWSTDTKHANCQGTHWDSYWGVTGYDKDGKAKHGWIPYSYSCGGTDYQKLNEWYSTVQAINISNTSASVHIKGSMYEDDYTGSRR